MNLRMPAYPIITIDPYFSVWSFDDKLNNSHTVHWTGKENRITGTVVVDGEKYCFMGKEDGVKNAEQISVDCTALSTVYKFSCGSAVLTAKFTSPLLIDDLEILSRPVSYLEVIVEGSDKTDVKITACEQLCLNEAGQYEVKTELCDCKIPTGVMGGNEQPVLKTSGDYIRIDYGYFYLSAPTGCVEFGTQDGMTVLSAKVSILGNGSALFAFSYDDIYSAEYFGNKCKSLWNNGGSSILEVIEKAVFEYKNICRHCDKFDKKLYDDARNVGGEKYAELLVASYRQIISAHKLVVDPNGELLWISKENSSNGCAATVDVTYPSAPMFMLYNTELLKGMLRPVFFYAESDKWNYDFAPHDVGTYPLINGQVYYDCKREYQMPVEECGNMLILSSAVAIIEKNTDFVQKHIGTIKLWAEYLASCGFDPENQLCTDDFAGHLAHNCNLSLKTICALAAFARVCEMLGEAELAQKYDAISRDMAEKWEKEADDGENYRLAFDQPNSFSLKYNLVWNKVMNLGLFDKAVAEKETACYINRLNRYGTPLDSREDYTKSDWLLWCASFAEKKEDFEKIVESVWNFYNETKDRVPMTDWYMSSSADQKVFQARSVLGGFWMPLLDSRDLFGNAEG